VLLNVNVHDIYDFLRYNLLISV